MKLSLHLSGEKDLNIAYQVAVWEFAGVKYRVVCHTIDQAGNLALTVEESYRNAMGGESWVPSTNASPLAILAGLAVSRSFKL